MQLFDGVGEKHEFGKLCGGDYTVSESKEAKFRSAVYVRKEAASVLEVVQADKRFRFHDILKEELGRVVSSDAGLEHTAYASVLTDDVSHCLSEYRVEIYASPSTKRITVRVSQKVAGSIVFA